MAGVSADDGKTTDLHLIMDGGENFLARMAALQNEKKAWQEAKDSLHLGIEIKRGLDEIAAQRAAIAKERDDARRAADDYWAKARFDANAMGEDARRVRDDALAYSKRTREAADAYSAQAMGVAEANKKATNEALKAAQMALADANGKQRKIAADSDALKEAQAKFKSEVDQHRSKAAMLAKVLGQIS